MIESEQSQSLNEDSENNDINGSNGNNDNNGINALNENNVISVVISFLVFVLYTGAVLEAYELCSIDNGGMLE